MRRYLIGLAIAVALLASGSSSAQNSYTLTGNEVPSYSVFTAFLGTVQTWAEGETAREPKLRRLIEDVGISDCVTVTELLDAAATVDEVYRTVPPRLRATEASDAERADVLSRARAKYIVRRLGGPYAHFLAILKRAGCPRPAFEKALRANFAAKFQLTTSTGDAAFVRQLELDFQESVRQALKDER